MILLVKFDDVREGDVIDILAENEILSFEVIFKDEELIQLRCEDFSKSDISRLTMTKKEFDEGGFTRKRRRSSI
jgi:predicted secreted protein